MIEEIKIHKNYKYPNGSLEINFKGENYNKKYSKEETNLLLDICQKNITLDMNPIEITNIVKTVFRNYKGKELEISILDDNLDKIIIFKFKEEELYQIYVKGNIKINGKITNVLIDYQLGENFSFSLKTKDKEGYKQSTSLLTYLHTLLIDLNGNNIHLDSETKKICTLYKLFYDEDPNFSSPEINVKMHALILLILSISGIQLNDKFTFVTYQGKKIPISPDLELKLIDLIPFGKIEVKRNSFEEISPKLVTALIELKKIIKEYTQTEELELDNIIKFANVFYANKCNAKKPNTSRISKISEETNYPIEEIDYIFTSVKKRILK